MHLLRYIFRAVLKRFLDRHEYVDWDAVSQCKVSAEPVRDPQLRIR